MTPTVSGECINCNQPFIVNYNAGAKTNINCCKGCGEDWNAEALPLEVCLICDCRYFYRQKDFNQLLGCGIVLFGAVIIPAIIGYVIGYRYLLIITICSLSFFTIIDVLLYRKVNDMAVCYDCRSEFRGFKIPPEIEHFEHFLAERFEKEK